VLTFVVVNSIRSSSNSIGRAVVQYNIIIIIIIIIIIVVIVRFKSFVKFNACSDVYPLLRRGVQALGIRVLYRTTTCSCGSSKRQKKHENDKNKNAVLVLWGALIRLTEFRGLSYQRFVNATPLPPKMR